MAKTVEDTSISEPEKVHRSPTSDGTDSSRPNCRHGANRGKIGRNASMLCGEELRQPSSYAWILTRRF